VAALTAADPCTNRCLARGAVSPFSTAGSFHVHMKPGLGRGRVPALYEAVLTRVSPGGPINVLGSGQWHGERTGLR
jgi:hypothetical protein